MLNRFIYTQDADVYLELLGLGFEDLGVVLNKTKTTYVVANSDKLQVPDEYKGACLFSNRMYL